MEVFILAGGKGTRLSSIVNDRPKPMADIGGKPFLEHLLNHYKNKQVNHFIISIGYKKELIRNHFGSNFHGIPISYAEENTPLGTGGAILNAKNFLKTDNPFLILNGDTFFDISVTKFVKFHYNSQALVSIALLRALEENRYGGVKINNKNRVVPESDLKAKLNDLANGGIYILSPKIIEEFSDIKTPFSLEGSLFPALFKKKIPIYGIDLTSRFIDIGMPADYKWCRENYKEIFYEMY